jgi:hypothetical protein
VVFPHSLQQERERKRQTEERERGENMRESQLGAQLYLFYWRQANVSENRERGLICQLLLSCSPAQCRNILPKRMRH